MPEIMLSIEGKGLIESKKLGREVTSRIGGFLIDPEIDLRFNSNDR